MKITIIYPYLINTGSNTEIIEGISNFQEKPYGISFNIKGDYMFIGYSNITGFFLKEEDKNDT